MDGSGGRQAGRTERALHGDGAEAAGRGAASRATEQGPLTGPDDPPDGEAQGAARQAVFGSYAEGAGRTFGLTRRDEDAADAGRRYRIGAAIEAEGCAGGGGFDGESLGALNPLRQRRAVQSVRARGRWRAAADGPEGLVTPQGYRWGGGEIAATRAAPVDAASIDRAFERDARRYDGGYILF